LGVEWVWGLLQPGFVRRPPALHDHFNHWPYKHKDAQNPHVSIIHTRSRKFHPVVRVLKIRMTVTKRVVCGTDNATHNIDGCLLAVGFKRSNNRTRKAIHDGKVLYIGTN